MNAPQTSTIHINQLPARAKLITFGHRSGAETHQRCPRAYYLNYEYLGRGITAAPGPLYFAVGSAVHHGLAAMLQECGIDECVERALDFFHDTSAYDALQFDQRVEQDVLVHGLLYAFWVHAYPSLKANFDVICVETGAVEYLKVGWEGCTCGAADAVVRDPSLTLAHARECGIHDTYVAMQSRPDAILRHKGTGEVAGWSWKTIDDPTDMRRSQLHNDLQGFMEMWYGERILEQLRGSPVTKEEIQEAIKDHLTKLESGYSIEAVLEAMRDFAGDTLTERVYNARNIPTQIDYIQTVFLVKGKRQLLEQTELPWINSATYSTDDDEFGGYAPDKLYRQMSHLCYRYRNGNVEAQAVAELYKSGPNKGKPKPIDQYDPNCQEESWAYRFFKPGNAGMSALSTKWLTSQIQPESIRSWIDSLAVGMVYPSTMGDSRNPHPLDKIIRFEAPMYRDVRRAEAHVKQQKRRYVQIAQAVCRVNDYLDSVADPVSGVKTLEGVIAQIDEQFPQHLISCRTPWRCSFHDFCHSPRESEIDFASVPQGFELREPHHDFERTSREQMESDGAGEVAEP